MRIVGIDCATDPKKVGLALSEFDEVSHRLLCAQQGAGLNLAETVAEWINHQHPVLIALDAPLGWPMDLGQSLHNHAAGAPIEAEGNQLFRRETDRFIKRRLNKQPLDVGADRIARTALAALNLLKGIRDFTGCEIPLAWRPEIEQTSAIEVYPAATLTSHVMPAQGYKTNSAEHEHVRSRIIDDLEEYIAIEDRAPLLKSADTLDAVICCLAAADFLSGKSSQPEDLELAMKEGWIWVRKTW